MKQRIMRSVLSEGQIHSEIIDTQYGKKLFQINASSYVMYTGDGRNGTEKFDVRGKSFIGNVYVNLKGAYWIADAKNVITDVGYNHLTPGAQRKMEEYFAKLTKELMNAKSNETRQADIWQVEASIDSVKSERSRLVKQLDDVDKRLAELNRQLATLKR